MELPRLKKKILSRHINSNTPVPQISFSLTPVTPKKKYSEIYHLHGNLNASLLLNYTQRMQKFKDHFSINRLVRSTKKEISDRRKIKSISTASPTSQSHLRSYKLSYSPMS